MTDYSDADLASVAICTRLDVPDDKFIDAAEAAINENPNNAPLRRPPTPSGGGGPFELALFTEKRWAPGRTITVSYMDGAPAVQAQVTQWAKVWEDHANIKLNFVADGDSSAEIRISFQHEGSWSYLGTDALVIDSNEATMNYGWLTPNSADDEYSRVVLHEFGHALAAIHEQQSPVASIPWNRDAVFRYYKLQGWDAEKTERNVLRRRDPRLFNHTNYDRDSIMQYAVPQALTEGDFEIGWNRVLSDMDKVFIDMMYPQALPSVTSIVPGDTTDADIGSPGEEDHYLFSVDDADTFTLETSGDTDVVMALYGPDDNTFLVRSNDDGGVGLNAKIVEHLAPGDYLVRIRHYSEERFGAYSLSLR
ncbi:MAG: peptidase [bacterium]|nr:peptidase [bacterium]